MAAEVSYPGFSNLTERVVASFYEAQRLREERIKEGTFLVYPTFEVALVGVFVYLVVTPLLYGWMSGRKEKFEPKWAMSIYNLICVYLAGYVVYGIVAIKLNRPGRFVCNDQIVGTEEAEKMAWFMYVFFAQKFWEFLDTWFFILRKSFRQVSFLHIYHHASICIVVASCLHFDYWTDFYLPALLNSFVHVLMYFHYFLSGLGIKGWWSQYLTSLQLIQFLIITFQNLLAIYYGPTCGIPEFSKVMMIFYMFSMLALFGKFYVDRYLSTGKKDQSQKKRQ